MVGALERLCERAEAAVVGGYNIIVLSDRQMGPDRIPIPALLATAAVHHHLIRKGLRTAAGLVVESGEPREVHHFACLAGYGAEAINPYLAFDTLLAMHAPRRLPPEVDVKEVVGRYIKSVGKGLLKVMSKMGISTYQRLLRRADLRRDRLEVRFREALLLRHLDDDSKAWAWRRSPARRWSGTRAPFRPIRCWPFARDRRRICLPHAAARPISGRPTPWPRCSMPCASIAMRPIRNMPRW